LVKKDNKMNRKTASVLAVVVILIFIGYIIFDTISPEPKNSPANSGDTTKVNTDKWVVSRTFDPGLKSLKAVAVSLSGYIYLGGDSYVTCYDKDLKAIWNTKTSKPVTALSVSGDTVFASSIETIFIINAKGEMKDEWGPYEDSSIITSVSANRSFVAFADAGNKIVVLLDRKGDLKTIIGKTGEPFIIPSPYFDVALTENNTLFIANTGNRRIEMRGTDGSLISQFGQAGTASDAFCGCCNPAHFALIPGGFVTAEKGINRIKILDENGNFVEFVSSVNSFIPSIPLDVASVDGKIIYAANPADGKLYIFNRR